MKFEVQCEIEKEIGQKKMDNFRILTDDEILEIIKKYKVKSHFYKRRIVREAKSGIDDINDLYRIYVSKEKPLDDQAKEFLRLSYEKCVKDLKEEDKAMGELEYTSKAYDHRRDVKVMKLAFIRRELGLSLDEYSVFIDFHKDIYKEVFSEPLESRKK